MINAQIDFGVGEKVRLNSGSPDLTLISSDGERVTVEWKINDDTVAQYSLPVACIKPLASRDSGVSSRAR